jgi:hypothetical protein
MTKVTRKLLSVSDDTDECMSAMLFSAFRAHALGVGVVILRCARPTAHFGWIGLDKDISQDAVDAARVKAMEHVKQVADTTSITPELVVSAEDPPDAIRRLVDADESIQMLVLAAGSGPRGPGPLVTRLSKGRPLADRPIAVVVVPAGVTLDQLRELSALSG